MGAVCSTLDGPENLIFSASQRCRSKCTELPTPIRYPLHVVRVLRAWCSSVLAVIAALHFSRTNCRRHLNRIMCHAPKTRARRCHSCRLKQGRRLVIRGTNRANKKESVVKEAASLDTLVTNRSRRPGVGVPTASDESLGNGEEYSCGKYY
jgi:hypothetical protein